MAILGRQIYFPNIDVQELAVKAAGCPSDALLEATLDPCQPLIKRPLEVPNLQAHILTPIIGDSGAQLSSVHLPGEAPYGLLKVPDVLWAYYGGLLPSNQLSRFTVEHCQRNLRKNKNIGISFFPINCTEG
jgi:hypothetical protein